MRFAGRTQLCSFFPVFFFPGLPVWDCHSQTRSDALWLMERRVCRGWKGLCNEGYTSFYASCSILHSVTSKSCKSGQIRATVCSLSRSPVSQAPGRVNYRGSQDWKVGQAPVLSAAFSAHCRHSVIQTDLLLLTVITRWSWAFRVEEGQLRNPDLL